MIPRARVLGVAVVLTLVAWHTRADGLTFSDAPLPAGVYPYRIASDGAGGVWLTDRSNRNVGHLTVDGTYTTIAIPTPADKLVVPESIAAAGGLVGFTFNTTNLDGSPFESDVGVLHPSSNSVTVYSMTKNAGVDPSQDTCANADCGIAAAVDGSFWFIEQNVSKIGRITISATAGGKPLVAVLTESAFGCSVGCSEYPISFTERPLTLPRFILAPPLEFDIQRDNRALFTTTGGAAGGTLSRIDTSGVLTVFPFTAVHTVPNFIALSGTTTYVARSDGAIQLVDMNAGVVGALIPPPVAGFQPAGMAFGPDRKLQVSDFAKSFIRTYDPQTAEWTEIAVPQSLQPADIAFSGNKMYFVGFPPGSFDTKLKVATVSTNCDPAMTIDDMSFHTVAMDKLFAIAESPLPFNALYLVLGGIGAVSAEISGFAPEELKVESLPGGFKLSGLVFHEGVYEFTVTVKDSRGCTAQLVIVLTAMRQASRHHVVKH